MWTPIQLEQKALYRYTTLISMDNTSVLELPSLVICRQMNYARGGGGGGNFHYQGIYRCAAGMGYIFQASQYMNGYHFYIKSISLGYLFHPKSI